MPVVKLPRRFGTKIHLVQLGTHFWSQDEHEYAKPAQRVCDWASINPICNYGALLGLFPTCSSISMASEIRLLLR